MKILRLTVLELYSLNSVHKLYLIMASKYCFINGHLQKIYSCGPFYFILMVLP